MKHQPALLELIDIKVLRCPECGYEKRIQPGFDMNFAMKYCPACSGSANWSEWAERSGAIPVVWSQE